MRAIRLRADEADIIGTIINIDFDGIDLYPGHLDPEILSRATDEVEAIIKDDGAGELSVDSARLAHDVIDYFRGLGAGDVAEAFERLLAKLAVASST